MNNTFNAIENTLIGFNSFLGFSLLETEHMLAIVLLVFQILLVISKLAFSIYAKIKTKKYDEIPGLFDEASKDLDELEKKQNEEN